MCDFFLICNKIIFSQMDDVMALTDMSHQDVTPRIANLEKRNKDLQDGTYIMLLQLMYIHV